MSGTGSSLRPWIVCPRPRASASLRLFCFPRAGAGVSAFRGWAEDSHPQMEIAIIQSPGREARLAEPPVTSMAELVCSAAKAISAMQDRPFAFYGHSLGGKVAFETARELRRRGLALPLHLFVAACSGPAIPWVHAPLRELDDVALLREIQKRYGGVPEAIVEDPELRTLLTPALRADMSIVETYRYQAEQPLPVPVSCFCGDGDWMTPEEEARDWQKHTSAEFWLQLFGGDHFFPAQVHSKLLDQIASDLNLASRRDQLVANPG